jgi:hypothetical protein
MTSEEEQHDPSGERLGSRRPWVPMSMQYLGRLGDLVLGGVDPSAAGGKAQGKPMVSLGDPGEPTRKPSGLAG